MPVVPWVRPSQGSVQAPAKGVARRLSFARRFGYQQAHLPVAGVKTERDRRRRRRAQAAVRAENEEFGIEKACGSQPMPAFWVRPKRLPEGSLSSISAVRGRTPAGPGECVATSSSLRVLVSRTEEREMVGMGVSCQGQL